MSQDPVQQIKEEEAKASQKLKEAADKNHASLEDHRITKEKELSKHKEELRAKGQESLEQAKQSAMAEFKKITEDEDRNRSSVISSASSKKDEALSFIIQAFEKHLTH